MLLKSLATGVVALGLLAGSLGAATLPAQAATYMSMGSNYHPHHRHHVQVCQTIWRHHHRVQVCNWVWRSW